MTMAASANMFFRECTSQVWEGPLTFRLKSKMIDEIEIMVLEYENDQGEFEEWANLAGYVASMPLKSESFYVFLLEVKPQYSKIN